MRSRNTPPLWNRAENLVRYAVVMSLLGAALTVLLDKLADTAGATSMVHSLVVNGSAGVFALGGVMLYNTGQRSRDAR
jgi:hypothetical protein